MSRRRRVLVVIACPTKTANCFPSVVHNGRNSPAIQGIRVYRGGTILTPNCDLRPDPFNSESEAGRGTVVTGNTHRLENPRRNLSGIQRRVQRQGQEHGTGGPGGSQKQARRDHLMIVIALVHIPFRSRRRNRTRLPDGRLQTRVPCHRV